MASWNDLLTEVEGLPDDEARSSWLRAELPNALQRISTLRSDRNIITFASAFLQKQQAPGQFIQITAEDLNGFMSVIYGMDWRKGLTLLLHTPGGVTNAAETIVDYLRRKFRHIEVVVPTFAMSAGTMIALASNRIVMGRQSQLGPIDPQLHIPASGRFVSARSIVEQFAQAKDEIVGDPRTAHAWAPVLQSLGGGLLQEAENALEYGESMVQQWLATYMFKRRKNGSEQARSAAAHFNDATIHKSHGRRISRDEARSQNLQIENLEKDQELQDAVLTAYHLTTIIFEKSAATKLIWSHANRAWLKSWAPPPS